MLQSRKDQEAESAIRKAIVGLFGDAIDDIEVRPSDDQNDRPTVYVTVFMKAAQTRMSSGLWLDTIAAATTALRSLDDERFAYVTFLAPEDESAEDTRPAA